MVVYELIQFAKDVEQARDFPCRSNSKTCLTFFFYTCIYVYRCFSLSLSARATNLTKLRTPPTSVTLVTSVTSGKITNFVEKNAIENVYFFFTYARCRRRLPSIKMINGVEEVFVLPFSALDYEYLF